MGKKRYPTAEEQLLFELVDAGCSVLVLAQQGAAKASAVEQVLRAVPEGEPISFARDSAQVGELYRRHAKRAAVSAPDAETFWLVMTALRAGSAPWLVTVAGGEHLIAAADMVSEGIRTSQTIASSYLARAFDVAVQFSPCGSGGSARPEALFASVGSGKQARFSLLAGDDARRRLFQTLDAKWGCRAAEKLRAAMISRAAATGGMLTA